MSNVTREIIMKNWRKYTNSRTPSRRSIDPTIDSNQFGNERKRNTRTKLTQLTKRGTNDRALLKWLNFLFPAVDSVYCVSPPFLTDLNRMHSNRKRLVKDDTPHRFVLKYEKCQRATHTDTEHRTHCRRTYRLRWLKYTAMNAVG